MNIRLTALSLLLLLVPPLAHAQFTYTTNNGALTITGYTGSGGAVTIPKTIDGLPVTTIGRYAFANSTVITSVALPNSVTNIGYCAFYACPGLTSIAVDPHNAFYSGLKGVLFDKSQTTLLQYPGGKTGSYTIPDGVSGIEDYAFAYCETISSTIIPSSVTNIGYSALSSCSSLTSISVDPLNLSYSSLNGVLFDKTRTALLQYPAGKTGPYATPSTVTSIGQWAFSSCRSLTSITLGDNLSSIADGAFIDCAALTQVTVPSRAATLGNWAFAYCTGLTKVTVGDGVARIGSEAFAYCTSLKGVYFRGNAPAADNSVFRGANQTTVYYLQGTSGWGPTFAGRPTALWAPPGTLAIITSTPGFGVQGGLFVFNLSGPSGSSVAIEATTSLANPTWLPLTTNILGDGSNFFVDPHWTNYPTRFYRLRALQ